MTIAIALIMAALIPLSFLYAIKAIDFYQTGSVKLIAISAVWGVIAYLLAALINPALVNNGLASRDAMLRYFAPFIEEILKGADFVLSVKEDRGKYILTLKEGSSAAHVNKLLIDQGIIVSHLFTVHQSLEKQFLAILNESA